MSKFKEVKDLRYWCQKVLPLVYDDSLSYYELLCKVVNKLNEMAENINAIPGYIRELVTEEYLSDILSVLLDELREQIAVLNDHDSKTCTADRNVGELIWLDDKLYRITRGMLAGDQYVLGSNIEKVNVEKLLVELRDSISDFSDALDEEITDRIAGDNALQGSIDEVTNGLGKVYKYVRTSGFPSVQEAVAYAKANGISHIKMDADTTVSNAILLFDGCDFDGCGHTIKCSTDFNGNRVFTNEGSGYWNADRTSYKAYASTLKQNTNIKVHDIVLGEYHRSNKKYDGTDIGGDCVVRGWLAFDNVTGLDIYNITNSYTQIECVIWTTRCSLVNISKCYFDVDGYAETGGCIWLYDTFDTTHYNRLFTYRISDCRLISANDEAIAIRNARANVVYNIKNINIENCYIASASGQGITYEGYISTSTNLNNETENFTVNNCTFYNSGIRWNRGIRTVNITDCVFISDSYYVSNQGYFIRDYGEQDSSNLIHTCIIKGCKFTVTKYNGAIYIKRASTLLISDCDFNTNASLTFDGITIGGVNKLGITNCSFKQYKRGIYFENTIDGVSQSISNCSFDSCSSCFEVYSKCHEVIINNCFSTNCDNFFNFVTGEIWNIKIADCSCMFRGSGALMRVANNNITGPVFLFNNVSLDNTARAESVITGIYMSDTHICLHDNYYGTNGGTSATITKYPNTLA